MACPWNKFAQTQALPDFTPRTVWDQPDLLRFWAWDEAEFLRQTEGSAIRRIGIERWQRNVAVALGNALAAGSSQDSGDPRRTKGEDGRPQ